MTTYLKDFQEFAKRGVVYIPVGTIEWHGNHAPLETDFLIAQKICEILSKDYSGYILPPIYFGTDKTVTVDGEELRGMDKHLGKVLPGSLYYYEPELLTKIFHALINNLKRQGFTKIIIVTGHAGSRHVATLKEIADSDNTVLFIDPYEVMPGMYHADEGETSVLWACYPEEEAKAKSIDMPEDDDYIKLNGYDPRTKASLELGKQYLDNLVNFSKKKIRHFLSS